MQILLAIISAGWVTKSLEICSGLHVLRLHGAARRWVKGSFFYPSVTAKRPFIQITPIIHPYSSFTPDHCFFLHLHSSLAFQLSSSHFYNFQVRYSNSLIVFITVFPTITNHHRGHLPTSSKPDSPRTPAQPSRRSHPASRTCICSI